MMIQELLEAEGLERLYPIKLLVPVLLLALFWLWETGRPFFGWRDARWRHAGRNLAIALLNTAVLAVAFGALTVTVAAWTTRNSVGLLHLASLPEWSRFAAALLLLDGWMYVWHRANHEVPLLWRFHRMHHSDDHMDVTTATRFHLGEHVGAATLRLGLIPLLGLGMWHIVIYEMLVLAVTQFHHADISLGRWDRWLRLVIVTPDMHKVHHSDRRAETNSNYSTVLSLWDRLARSLRLRADLDALRFGLPEFDDARWQTLWGMFKTPFAALPRSQNGRRREDAPPRPPEAVEGEVRWSTTSSKSAAAPRLH